MIPESCPAHPAPVEVPREPIQAQAPPQPAYAVRMPLFHRPSLTAAPRVQLLDVEPDPPPDAAKILHLIAAEALILQDEAEDVLAAVRRHEHLGTVAPRGGPLVRRFFSLRERLPRSCADPQLDQLRGMLDTIV